jgi:NAD-dependent dihydropyrimidine dehydrogenase PreA subunit
MIQIFQTVMWLILLPALTDTGVDPQRFPPPDFDSGYELPLTTVPEPRGEIETYIDMAVLLGALSLASFLALKKRSRNALFCLAAFSLAYFGFYREGCVCAIGSIQNMTLALFESGYSVPLSVVFFFVLPLAFTLFFGRAFCAAVCPLGTFQDLALIRPVNLPYWIDHALGLLAYVYLGLAVLFAATGSAFIICEYDPFVAFFRMSGSFNMVVVGMSFLLISFFIGRPYCRFFCPYGVLLRWMSRFSRWRVTVTPDECILCRLCEDACPFNALDRATPEEAPPPGPKDRKRLLFLFALLPVLVVGGGWIGSGLGTPFASMHNRVHLAERIQEEENGLVEGTTDASKAFRDSGEPIGVLLEEAVHIREQFTLGGWILGGFLGLVVAGRLIRLSLFRRRKDYEADRAACYACGRCFSYCPIELERRKEGGAAEIGVDLSEYRR